MRIFTIVLLLMLGSKTFAAQAQYCGLDALGGEAAVQDLIKNEITASTKLHFSDLGVVAKWETLQLEVEFMEQHTSIYEVIVKGNIKTFDNKLIYIQSDPSNFWLKFTMIYQKNNTSKECRAMALLYPSYSNKKARIEYRNITDDYWMKSKRINNEIIGTKWF